MRRMTSTGVWIHYVYDKSMSITREHCCHAFACIMVIKYHKTASKDRSHSMKFNYRLCLEKVYQNVIHHSSCFQSFLFAQLLSCPCQLCFLRYYYSIENEPFLNDFMSKENAQTWRKYLSWFFVFFTASFHLFTKPKETNNRSRASASPLPIDVFRFPFSLPPSFKVGDARHCTSFAIKLQ